jgi:hypothetical protein
MDGFERMNGRAQNALDLVHFFSDSVSGDSYFIRLYSRSEMKI